jgi:uncharacterized membrane protein HdeD (DUF308 family)
MAGAALVLILHPVNAEMLTYGFAAWVAVASSSMIVGALGMKRRTASTRYTFVTTGLPTLLAGLGGLALSAFVFADPDRARLYLGAVIAVYSLVRGAADIALARRRSDTIRPRWLLYSAGAFGIITAVAILAGPDHGRGVLRLSLALYLGLTGATLVGYVVTARRAVDRRLREVLGG